MLRQLLNASSTSGDWLVGLIDRRKIALAGHSDGGDVVAALVYDNAYRVAGVDPRAVAVLSGTEFSIANQIYAQPATGPVPLLVVQSATDRCVPPWEAEQLYNAIAAPKYFLKLDAASHLGAYSGAEAEPSSVVQRSTVAFFDQALGLPAASPRQLSTAATHRAVSTLTTAPVAIPIPTPRGSRSCPKD